MPKIDVKDVKTVDILGLTPEEFWCIKYALYCTDGEKFVRDTYGLVFRELANRLPEDSTYAWAPKQVKR